MAPIAITLVDEDQKNLLLKLPRDSYRSWPSEFVGAREDAGTEFDSKVSRSYSPDGKNADAIYLQINSQNSS